MRTGNGKNEWTTAVEGVSGTGCRRYPVVAPLAEVVQRMATTRVNRVVGLACTRIVYFFPRS